MAAGPQSVGWPGSAESGGTFDVIEEIVGDVEPDEDYRQQCNDLMKEFWNKKAQDRWPE